MDALLRRDLVMAPHSATSLMAELQVRPKAVIVFMITHFVSFNYHHFEEVYNIVCLVSISSVQVRTLQRK